MSATKIAVEAAINDACWRIIDLEIAADGLPPFDPRRGPLLEEAAMLRRRIEQLLSGEPDTHTMEGTDAA